MIANQIKSDLQQIGKFSSVIIPPINDKWMQRFDIDARSDRVRFQFEIRAIFGLPSFSSPVKSQPEHEDEHSKLEMVSPVPHPPGPRRVKRSRLQGVDPRFDLRQSPINF